MYKLTVLGLLVGNSVNRAGRVVRYRQRAVGQDLHVHGAPPHGVALEPPLSKGLVGNRLIALQFHDRNSIADLSRAVPRSMLRYKDLVTEFGGEHRAGIEAHAERGDVRPELLRRRLEFG